MVSISRHKTRQTWERPHGDSLNNKHIDRDATAAAGVTLTAIVVRRQRSSARSRKERLLREENSALLLWSIIVGGSGLNYVVFERLKEDSESKRKK